MNSTPMIYTKKLKEAITFSIKTHEVYQKQKRKGKDIPYITHPLTVGLILAHAGASEDVIIAGILHDTVEDSSPEKSVSKEMIAERFGESVAALVMSVTEEAQSRPWEVRKNDALEHIAHFSHGSLLVKSADTIWNVSEIMDDHRKDGDDMFARFHSSKERTVANYLEVTKRLLLRWPESPLAKDLRHIHDQLLVVLFSPF